MKKSKTSLFDRKNRILLKELVKTDFKLRYNGSVLGMVWSVLKPLLLFAVMYLVFVHFLRFGAGIPHFAVSLLLAITLWSFFAECTGAGMRSIVDRGDLMRKINIPRYIIVVSTTVSALINLGISLIVVLVFAIINGVEFQGHILLVPLLIIELYILSLGMAFLLSTLYVKFRDLAHIWDVIMQAGFYFTPIIYPISMVAAFSIEASKIMMLNPMAQIIQDVRYLFTYSGTETVWNYIDSFYIAIIPLAIVIIIAIIGSLYFRKNSRKFAEMI